MKTGLNPYHLALGILILSPSVISMDPLVISPASKDSDGKPTLRIGDSLICNDISCYPKVFEATTEWKEIRPAQVLPGGLDIRVNLETGQKEAKLVEMKISDQTNDFETIKDLGLVVEHQDSHDEKGAQGDYEFTKDFNVIKGIMANINDEKSVFDANTLETKLDDLMEFAHDYKHGYGIITHELALLDNMSSNALLPLSLRELSARMINSCLRNNPPVINYINEVHPSFVNKMFDMLRELSENHSTESLSILTKRYLSTLNELLPSMYIFTSEQLQTFGRILSLEDKQIKIKVLELASKMFSSEFIPSTDSAETNLQKFVPDLQTWAREYETLVQDKSIDELHTREFFNSLYNIKQEVETDVKISSQFLSWLEQQADSRQQNLESGLEHRDLEQDSFDKKLIESRHLIFGNPLAHRIKYFEDEL